MHLKIIIFKKMLEIEPMEPMDLVNNPSKNRIEKIQNEKRSDLVSFGSVDKTKFTLLDKLINDYG